METALYWQHENNAIRCELCPHRCLILPEQSGRCQIRINHENNLKAGGYAQIAACALDPIEKKPLFHVKPGQSIFSIGSVGCNFKCAFCQNWELSQILRETVTMTPTEVAEQAKQTGSCGVAYTYNEPIINIEYVLDCAKQVRRQGLINVMVSNGYINPNPLEALIPWIDAWNVDLKSLSDSFYQDICEGHVGPVMKTIKRLSEVTHLEVTHLMVTDERHSLQATKALIDWLADVSPQVPLHLSRYFPQYKFEADATKVQAMLDALEYGRDRLNWIYLGNVQGQEDHTYCPTCKTKLIERHGYQIHNLHLTGPTCPKCQAPFYGLL